MPEVWYPFGKVETLVTIQAENLGGILEPASEGGPSDMERWASVAESASALFVCDARPSTIEVLSAITRQATAGAGPKIFAATPKAVESAAPNLKGRVVGLSKPATPEKKGEQLGPGELAEPGGKLFLGTASPDPLYGIADTQVEACLNWISGTASVAADRRDLEPTPFQKTESYEAVKKIASKIAEARFLTIVPRGGKARAILEKAPFDAVKNSFLQASMSPAKGLIVGPGGGGYDDTLSGALRSSWGALNSVRKGGEVLVIAECSQGLGSLALEMLVSGRISGEGGKRDRYVEGLEEIYYLQRLREDYHVLLLSGLPELFVGSKLGLTTARGSGEAVGRFLGKIGRSGKVNMVTRAAECRLQSA